MRHHLSSIAATSAFALAGLLVHGHANACGGCFHQEAQTESTVVTGHRMAFALSPIHTVLWDQIQYSGSPESFAWVLPVKAGAKVELSTDAWFEALEAGTSARVVSPPLDCAGATSGGCSLGCGATAVSDGGGGRDVPNVTVIHEGTVGPYETVTLHANVPNALPSWLTSHGFAIDPSVSPIVDAYTSEGFDFIALRLLPNKDVKEMKPVRVVTPGMSPTLPLRMVAAGTGAMVDITLFVISEGRYQAQNFPNGEVDGATLVWDFAANSSNYPSARKALLATGEGRTWNGAYGRKGALLSQLTNPITTETITYSFPQQQALTIGEAYIRQGIINGEGLSNACLGAFESLANSVLPVSELCSSTSGGAGGGGGTGGSGAGGNGGSGGAGSGCAAPGDNEIDAQQLVCTGLDDLAVAMVGLHPADVTLTRMEASLPHAALATDLILEAATAQVDATNWFSVATSIHAPCAAVAVTDPPRSGWRTPGSRNRAALMMMILAALGATLGRRVRRPALVPVRARR